MKSLKLSLLAFFCLCILWSNLTAGVLLVSVSEFPDQPDETETNRTYINSDRVRTEIGTGQVAIFRGDKDVFWFIDNEDRTYTELTREDIQKMKAQLEETSKMFEEQMQNLPPEQRKMMESMMGGKMPEKPPELKYKKIASGQKIGQWTCDEYVGYLDGQKHAEVWTTPWKDLGLSSEDFDAMKQMSSFFEEFSKDAAHLFKVGDESAKKDAEGRLYSGMPVKMIGYSGDQQTYKLELKEVKKQDCPASLFELPEGLKKQDFNTEEMGE